MRVLFGEITIGIGLNVEVTHLVDLFNHMHNLEDAEIGLKLNRGIVIKYHTWKHMLRTPNWILASLTRSKIFAIRDFSSS